MSIDTKENIEKFINNKGNIPLMNGMLDKGLISSVNVNDEDGITALMYQSDNGTVDAMKFLLEKGANETINAQDRNTGETALFKAVMTGNFNKVPLLLQYGADPTIKNIEGITPYVYCYQSNIMECRDLLKKYENKAKPEDIEEFVLNIEAGPEIKRRALLISKKIPNADVQEPNEGSTALMISSESFGRLDVMQFLLENGADINFRDKNGKTALHYAAKGRRQRDKVNFLLEKRARTDIMDNDGNTALDIARSRGNTETVDLIESFARRLIGGSMGDNNYHKNKYIKYKKKYLELKSKLK
jgi:serine/threonine-protein phosphatase 6 regulatory ankyrin repeat subunit A/serine/threonine-protein phosphatase 6 regulatory ankyrin repeat subunit B